MNTTTTTITKEIIDQAYDYSAFNQFVESLLDENRTTNDDNTESQLNYTKLNVSRTNRWDKRGVLTEETQDILNSITNKQTWLVITEGWCGDSAQILPFISKMADLNEHIELKIILRDQYPEIMDEFLTDGKSRSIPKVVIMDTETLEVLGVWGPRPIDIHKNYLTERLDPEVGGKKAAENLHIWYARDKGKTSQKEFSETLNSIKY